MKNFLSKLKTGISSILSSCLRKGRFFNDKLSLYDFLKHMSDKRGVHIDVGHSLVVEMVNNADSSELTPVHYLAIQMIYASKKQIIELSDYWPEMPELII